VGERVDLERERDERRLGPDRGDEVAQHQQPQVARLAQRGEVDPERHGAEKGDTRAAVIIAGRMRAFTCPACRHLVIFESTDCLHCGARLGFDWDAREIRSLAPGAACANRDTIACNGAAGAGRLCPACLLTRTRPADGTRPAWRSGR
jgi:hypothetical protein